MNKGVQYLTDGELLAILLRTGTKNKNVIAMAQELLSEFHNLAQLARASASDLQRISGIKHDKAATLLAAFEIGRRSISQNHSIDKQKITSAQQIADFFIPLLTDKTVEVFIVVLLDSANHIINHKQISEGTLDASMVATRDIFKAAIMHNAKSVILLHNHPSGNPEPSAADIQITNKIVEAGKIMNIEVLDHLIIAKREFTSFAERNLLQKKYKM